MQTKLRGKHALVTGASGGIGVEITRLFLEEGTHVTAGYFSKPRALVDLKERFPSHVKLVQADVSVEKDVQSLYSHAIKSFGRVDIAVATAGIAPHEPTPVHKMSIDQWRQTISVNLTGIFLTSKYFFDNLEKHPGDEAVFIMIGSTAGEIGEALFSDYSTSKAGLHGLLKSLKNEIVHLAKKGRVNLINPGWTRTPMAGAVLEDKQMLGRVLQTIPMRKIAEPIDVANAVIYLASDHLSGHVSGQTITIAGGMEGRVLFDSDENGV